MRMALVRGFDRPAYQILVLPFTCALCVAIHETAHALAGVAVGYRITRFVVGRIGIDRDSGSWRVRLIPFSKFGYVGLVPSTFTNFAIRNAILAGAGPSASFVSGGLFTALWLDSTTPQSFWISGTCALWCLIFLTELIPTSGSDGWSIGQAFRGVSALDIMQAKLFVSSSHLTSLRPSGWPRDVISRLARLKTDLQMQRYYWYLAYIHFLDAAEIETARQHLDALMTDWSSSDPPEWALERAYFYARHQNNYEEAKSYVAIELRDAEPWVRLRARAAVEWAACNEESMRRLVEEALRRLSVARACGAHQYEIDLLRNLASTVSGAPRTFVAGPGQI
jgi:hypothetical protein